MAYNSKLNTIDFATLVSWISSKNGSAMDRWEVEDLEVKILNMIPDPVCNTVYANCDDVRNLIRDIADGNKIAAIKTYRTLTGEGLKESKDAIETVRSNSLYTTS